MINENRLYDIGEALDILKLNRRKKFIENVDISVNLSFLPKNKSFVIKGYSILPYGSPKKFKIAVFTTDTNFSIKSDLDYKILSEVDLNNINKKNLFFDLILTTPTSMVKFGKLGKILGPKNLMPDIKYGTITSDINLTFDLLKKNYIRFRSDKSFVLNSKIGSIDLKNECLIANLNTLINDIKRQKPKDCKSLNVDSLYLTSTMGTSFKLEIKSLFN